MSSRTDPMEDPLSIILDDVDVAVCAVRDISGHLHVQAFRPLVPGFVAVLEGECQCSSGGSETVNLCAGELLFLIRGGPFELQSSGVSDVHSINEQTGKAQDEAVSDSMRMIAGGLRIAERCHSTIRTLIPDLVHFPHACDKLNRGTTLVRHFVEECRNSAPGSLAIRDQLARIAICTAVRQRLQREEFPSIGVARALTDADIGPILAEIHRSPERPWTIEALAAITCLSRTTFSQRFRVLAGIPVMEYVTDYRMRCAVEMLINARLPLKEIASKIGYRSLSAFGTAFKRWSGTAPDVFRRDLHSVASRIMETDAAASVDPACPGHESQLRAEDDLPIGS